MASKSPVFPISTQPQHFSDYGFDPQIDYFQVLEEARKHRKDSTTRSLDALHFKLQKPISKEDTRKTKNKNKNKKKKWWKNALLFWKWKWADETDADESERYIQRNRAYLGALSGPVYVTESRSGSVTPCRTSRPSSGPLAPARNGDLAIAMPYVSLRELNMIQQEEEKQRVSASAMPIYLVT